MTLPDFVPPSVAKAANAAKGGPEVSNFSGPSNGQPAENELPLAAKLRALGCPIAFEVEGEVVFWLVADDEAARRTAVEGAIFTAAEAETLAQFDATGIRDLAKLKAAFGGTLGPNGDDDLTNTLTTIGNHDD